MSSSYQNNEGLPLVDENNHEAVVAPPRKRSLGMALAGLFCLALASYYAGMIHGQRQQAELISDLEEIGETPEPEFIGPRCSENIECQRQGYLGCVAGRCVGSFSSF